MKWRILSVFWVSNSLISATYLHVAHMSFFSIST